MKRLSVIVPVYKVEEYLEKCLDSILKQNIQDMEILVVNDGSPDNCLAIMEKYADAYPDTVRIFSKENGGLSDARNFGIERAEGRYLSFVDSDDYLAEGMLDEMLSKAEIGDFDMVACGLSYVYADRTEEVYPGISEDVSESSAVKRSMTTIYPAACNKLFNRRIFDAGLRFKKGVWFEDVEFIHRAYPFIESIGIINKPYYQYVQREGAITSVFDARQFDYIKNWESIIKYYKGKNIFSEYEKELQYSCSRYVYATFMKGLARAKNTEMYWKGFKAAKKLMKDNFSNPWNNPYYYKNGIKGLYLLTYCRFTAELIRMFKK